MEAVVLSYVDDLDSKINGIRTHFEKESHNDSSWTGYHRLYDQYFFRSDSEEESGDPVSIDSVTTTPKKKVPQPINGQSLGATLGDRLKAARIELPTADANGANDNEN